MLNMRFSAITLPPPKLTGCDDDALHNEYDDDDGDDDDEDEDDDDDDDDDDCRLHTRR